MNRPRAVVLVFLLVAAVPACAGAVQGELANLPTLHKILEVTACELATANEHLSVDGGPGPITSASISVNIGQAIITNKGGTAGLVIPTPVLSANAAASYSVNTTNSAGTTLSFTIASLPQASSTTCTKERALKDDAFLITANKGIVEAPARCERNQVGRFVNTQGATFCPETNRSINANTVCEQTETFGKEKALGYTIEVYNGDPKRAWGVHLGECKLADCACVIKGNVGRSGD